MFQNQEYRKRRSDEKVKEHVNTRIFSKSYIIKQPTKVIKPVQEALSSIDLLTIKNKKYRREIRKTKSYEDIHKRRKNKKHEEILEWLHEVYNVKKVKYWSEKLQRIAEKLKRPGGEEKLRTKIVKCLQMMPSQFSDCDEDGKEFRQQLPNHIIKKLKIYLKKNTRAQNHKADRVEGNLKLVIKCWLQNIPIKKKDFLARPIKKEDIVDSLAQRLEPFILHRPCSDQDFKCMLKSYTVEIVNEMPIEIKQNFKNGYVDKITDELVDLLMKLNSKKQNGIKYEESLKNTRNDDNNNQIGVAKSPRNAPSQDYESASEEVIKDNYSRSQYSDNEITKSHTEPTLKAMKDFVTDEITRFLEETELGISRKRMGYIEAELCDICMDAIKSAKHYPNENVKRDIIALLKDIGNLSENQAKYFTNSIYRHFREKFLNETLKKPRTFGNTYLENYYVTYKPIQNLPLTKNTWFLTTDKDLEDNINSYTNKIANQIDRWLTLLHIQTPFAHQPVFREMAIGDLARDIVNRQKYLVQNPFSKSTEKEELDHLKFQISKWIGKLVGDQDMEVVEFAPDLMRRIQSISVTGLISSKNRDTKQDDTPKCSTDVDNIKINARSYFDQLYGEIFVWLQEIPSHLHYCEDVRTRYQFAENLVDRIELGIKIKRNIRTVIDTEVDFWIKKALKDKPQKEKISELKDIIKTVLVGSEALQNVTLQIETTTSDTENNTEFMTEEISSDEIEEDFELFTTQLAKIIDEWISNLIPRLKYKSYKETAVNGLATDIVERYKQNILHQVDCETKDDYVDNMKYSIFKWMKNLVGDDIVLVIEHASNLMVMIENIQKPTLAKQSPNINLSTQWSVLPSGPRISNTDELENISAFTSTNSYVLENSTQRQIDKSDVESNNHVPCLNPKDTQTKKSATSFQSNITTEPTSISNADNESRNNPNTMIETYFRQRDQSPECIKDANDVTGRDSPLNQVPIFGGADETKNVHINVKNERFNSLNYTVNSLAHNDTEVYNILPIQPLGKQTSKEDKDLSKLEESRSFSVHIDTLNVPKGMTVNETYQYFDKIFKEKSQQLPIPATTEEQKSLAEITRSGIYNGIWKTYFKLKSDPSTENDYGLFECTFEDELDSLLDCLPQIPQLKDIRHTWKLKVLQEVLNMLKYIHTITDAPSFRQHLTKKFSRKFLKSRLIEYSDQLQYAFVSGAADAFILYTRFKNDDPIKANIYRKRLMQRLQALSEYVKKTNDIEFRNVDQNQLCQEAFKILGSVQVPNDETLKSEADEILYGDEIEQWYNELPVKLNTSEFDELMKNKVIDLLAKKLHDLEKYKDPDDPTVEREMRHEISQFLERKADLQPDECLNINYMVDALTNRLKNRRLNALGYSAFEQENPVSSTFNNQRRTIFAPFVNQPTESSISKPSLIKQSEQPVYHGGVMGTSQMRPSTGYGQSTIPGLIRPQSAQRFTNPKVTGILGAIQANPISRYGPQIPGTLENTANSDYRSEVLANQHPEYRVNTTGFGFNQNYSQGLDSVPNYVSQRHLHQNGYLAVEGIIGPRSDDLMPIDEESENEDEDEIVRCRCMERIYRSRRKRFSCLHKDLERFPCLYELVHPYQCTSRY